MEEQGKNSGPRLKVCGVRLACDLVSCFAAGVDYVGFNFYRKSKRFIEPGQAASAWSEACSSLKQTPPPHLAAVVVDPGADDLKRIRDALPDLAVVQFHGEESPEAIAALARELPGVTLWKALRIASSEDLNGLERWRAVVSLVLLDSFVPGTDESLRGGTGHRFSWDWLEGRRPPLAFGMAGGIHPGNVQAALGHAPLLIDACSGVESEPGVKDRTRIEALVQAIGAARCS